MARHRNRSNGQAQIPGVVGFNSTSQYMSYAKAHVIDQIGRLQAELDGPLRNVPLPASYSPIAVPQLGRIVEERQATPKPQGNRRGSTMSAAARKRISEAQKARWAKRKDTPAGEPTGQVATEGATETETVTASAEGAEGAASEAEPEMQAVGADVAKSKGKKRSRKRT
jgi:hypothetical protein